MRRVLKNLKLHGVSSFSNPERKTLERQHNLLLIPPFQRGETEKI